MGKHKKQYKSVGSMLKNKMSDIHNESISESSYIPDIVEFCYDKKYLNLKGSGIRLYPMQEIMLKVFYRGSSGNENLILSEEEIDLLKKFELDNSEKGNVISKYYSGETFRELVLVWGRRAGKDFVSSVIALYEAMRLLECLGGNPYAIYGIGSASPITILTVATASGQASIAFNEMKEKVLRSTYFSNKYIPEGITSNEIYLLTPQDIKENIEFKKKRLPLRKGSIVLETGHSNSDALLGKQVFVLILDEVASYKQTGGSASGERIYTAMTPSLNTFGRNIEILDKDGKPKVNEKGDKCFNRVYDSKIVSISSPRGQEGIFYKIFRETPHIPDRLACRLPTWKVKPDETYESLKRTNPNMSEEEFWMEFGAEFSGTAGENFFPSDSVKECFILGNKLRLKNNDLGTPGFVYFVHLDPASSSHNYALVVLHRENFLDSKTRKADFLIVVDHVKYWHPTPGNPIKVEEVDDYVIGLRRRFNLGLVTFDQWNSKSSIDKLKSHGIPAKCTRFVKQHKMAIYDELYNLVVSNKIAIPKEELLMKEMLSLQRKYTGGHGYKIFPNKEGEIQTDDCCDSLAGACYSAMNTYANRLPKSKLVNIGVSLQSNQVMWRSMQGIPYGYGSGQQVAKLMEKRHQFVGKKRG